MIAPLATEVIRPYCEAGVLATLTLPIDLKLGVGGIITLRGQRLLPAVQVMLDVLRSAAGISGDKH